MMFRTGSPLFALTRLMYSLMDEDKDRGRYQTDRKICINIVETPPAVSNT
jgi:hypothetical protein